MGFADRLVLTKTDRVDQLLQTQLQQRLRTINARAMICQAVNGKLDRDAWLDIHGFYLNENLHVEHPTIKSILPSPPTDSAPAHSVVTPSSLPSQSWNDNIHSHVFNGKEMDIKKIGAFIEQCIERHGNDMLRYKGIIAIANEPRRFIVQGCITCLDLTTAVNGNPKNLAPH